MTNEEIDILIYRFLEEQTSPEEEKHLLAWVESSKENREYFVSTKKIHVHAQTSSIDFNTEEALQNILPKLSKPQTKTRKLYFAVAAVAASIVLLLGIWQTYTPLDSENIELAVAKPINYIANDSTQRFVLADSSIVTVYKGSSITVNDFNQKSRAIQLNGKAYFEVTPNKEKPFVISVGTAQVTVLGTSFEVNQNTALNEVIVSVIEGRVQVVDTLTKANYILTANELCVISPSTAYKSTFTNSNFLAWKTGKLVFDDTPLATVVKDLSSMYNREFIVSSEAANSCKLNATFTADASINEVNAVLSLLLKAHIEEKDSVIYLNLKSCDK